MLFYSSFCMGITRAHKRYAIKPSQPNPHMKEEIIHIILTSVESISKYSAIPPQTPNIFLSFFDRVNRFIIVYFSFFSSLFFFIAFEILSTISGVIAIILSKVVLNDST